MARKCRCDWNGNGCSFACVDSVGAPLLDIQKQNGPQQGSASMVMWDGYEKAMQRDPYGVAVVLDVANRVPATDARRNMSPPLEAELAWIIERESRWNPGIQNSIGATGLIQFMPQTAKDLGTTTDELKGMTLEEQAYYVDRYFARVLGKVGPASKPGDLYMATFLPEDYHKPDDYITAASDSTGIRLKIWEQNPGLRCSPQGPITPKCVRSWGTPKSEPATPFPTLSEFKAKPARKAPSLTILLIAALIAWLASRNQ